MNDRLDGRVALVTGASSGIGAGVAIALAAAGARVAVNHRSDDELAAALAVVDQVEGHGVTGLAVRADVAIESDVTAMVATVTEAFGSLDILVNNAGHVHVSPVRRMDVADWDTMMAVHLRGTFLTCRAVLDGMFKRDHGRIINTASQLVYLGARNSAHYAAAKAGIIGFTRTLALEIGSRNVTANCVAPGATHTPILDGVDEQFLEDLRQTIPKNRLAEVEDLLPAYRFLAADEAGYITGQVISPNGGQVFV